MANWLFSLANEHKPGSATPAVGLCFARALVLGMAVVRSHRLRGPLSELSQMSMDYALGMMRKAGIAPGREISADDWPVFQRLLGKHLNLVIISRDHFNSVVFVGLPKGGGKILALYHGERHYSVVTSLKAFFGVRFVCNTCLKTGRSKARHVCSLTCNLC